MKQVGINEKTNIKLVSIICLVYNHEPYIRKTIESFLMQKTDFDYEIIIHDDASTDRSLEIINEYKNKYPDKIVVISQKENKYQKGINITSTFIYPIIKGKYISCCEGDDYWTDCNMLQEQADFLESHSDYVAIGGITRFYNDENEEVLESKPRKKYYNREIKKAEHYKDKLASIGTATLMYRSEIKNNVNYLNARKESPRIGDTLLSSILFEQGKVFVVGKTYQHHRIQTRKNASNFNSLYSYKEKYIYAINAVNAIYRNICHEKIVANKIRRHTALFFCFCLLKFELGTYFECRNKLIKEIKEPTIFILIREIPLIVFEKIKNERYKQKKVSS